jgi:putative inorganic carbon (HCO3(-)) transporter
MNPPESALSRAARWLTFGSAASILFSIAVSQTLLALAFAALLASGEKLRLPRIKWALALFMLGTLFSLAFSGDPAVYGLPQVRKFYVFLELLVVFSCLRNLKVVRWLFLTWAGIGAITALRGCVQFAGKVEEAHRLGRSFYDYYVVQRITGFTSHWNTYSAEEMFALIMVAALLMFAPRARRNWIWTLCGILIAAAVVLGETRGIWIATAAAAVYLVVFWRPWLLALIPVAILLVYAAAPAEVRERITSIARPSSVDSNQFRKIAWSAGIAMIERHPLLGIGPDGPKFHFQEYVPADVWRTRPPGFYEHLHNVYLQLAADRGIPTMLAMLWMLIQMPIDFWRGLRALPPGPSVRRFLLHGAVAVVLAVMVEGFVEYNLGDSEVLAMFLVATACGYLALEKDVAPLQ